MDVITCHINADFDCLASMVGAKRLFPEAVLVFPGSMEKPVRDFLKAYPVEFSKVKDIPIKNIKRLIIVDTQSPLRIGQFADVVGKSGVITFIYDHHVKKQNDIHGTFETIEEAGATATIITELLVKKSVTITALEATILCLGIYEETGSMRFSSTTERDLRAAAYLLRRGANLNIVSAFLRPLLSKEDLELLNALVSSLSEVFVSGIRVKIGVAVRDSYFGDVAYMAHYIMDMEETDAVVLVFSMEGKTLLVGRSKVPELNMAELMAMYEGGGHSVAASATIKEGIPEIVVEGIKDALKKLIKPVKTAKEIMTSPVITIKLNSTIKEAGVLLTKYEINVLPVVKEDSYVGVISREIVEKAIFHGFQKSPIDDFITTDAATATTGTSVSEIEETMVEKNQRFLPVLAGETIVGAITRTDLLRNLYEDYVKRDRTSSHSDVKTSQVRNIASLLKERFPASVFDILKDVGDAADSLGMTAYLVGGAVRDLLRFEQNLDIDIVVEGDGIALAHELSVRFSGRVKTHERFQTAKVYGIKLHGTKDFVIDIATARTEYYEEPGALPQVISSSVKKDLYRRDFTINTLAVCLNKRDFGKLIDYFGAQRDLKEKTIRVLHNLSFIEDPTRAFRAVRFSERFDFKISKHTERLIKTAVKFDLFGKVSGTRVYDEMSAVFRELDPAKALRRLSSYGLLRAIHPDFTFNKELDSILKSIHAAISWYKLTFFSSDPDIGRIYLMGIMSTIPESSRRDALIRLTTPPNITDNIINSLKYTVALPDSDNPAVLYHFCKNLSIETVLFIMAVNKGRQQAITRYLVQHRHIEPLLTGKELKEMGLAPGPVFRDVFDQIVDARITGVIKDRDDEIALVKERFLNSALLL
ncbi:CBS domain-containing protein [Candidatus Magnetomonas plexicatena]|uniref:CBS domain-containing protein n=1 Tax=Candidatus Magnetomonas plexicatena TaxID=2552947 RepID=UPI001C74DC99|nr:CBS domain-containing protein [Nitrospirales bacterium LBB_01]